MLPSSQQQAEKERVESQMIVDAARREGDREAREQAARENQELRNQLDAARLEAETAKSEAARTLQEQEQKAQALRHDDKGRMTEAWNHAKGRADEHIKNDALIIRAASEENRRLRLHLEQHRTARESLGKTTFHSSCAGRRVHTCGPAGRCWLAGEG
eukprot:2613320-Pyramimonas_sp.AAC.3